MAKSRGIIGFSISEETSPGIWEDKITEKRYYQELINRHYRVNNGSTINDNVTVSHQVSIVADSFALNNYNHIAYVVVKGVKWCVNNITIQRPRLVLTLGGLYHE